MQLLMEKDTGSTTAEMLVIRADDPAVRDLLPGYLERRKLDVARAKENLNSGDFDAIRQLGHRLLGSGGAYGIEMISTLGDLLERAAEDEDTAALQQLLDRLDKLVSTARIV